MSVYFLVSLVCSGVDFSLPEATKAEGVPPRLTKPLGAYPDEKPASESLPLLRSPWTSVAVGGVACSDR